MRPLLRGHSHRLLIRPAIPGTLRTLIVRLREPARRLRALLRLRPHLVMPQPPLRTARLVNGAEDAAQLDRASLPGRAGAGALLFLRGKFLPVGGGVSHAAPVLVRLPVEVVDGVVGEAAASGHCDSSSRSKLSAIDSRT